MQRITYKVKRVHALLFLVRFILYGFRLLHMYLIAPMVAEVLPLYVRIRKRLIRIYRVKNIKKRMSYWRSKEKEILEDGRINHKVTIHDLGLDSSTLRQIIELQQKSEDVIIAEIDQDGFLLPRFGAIRHAPTIEEKDFLPRTRSPIVVVALGKYVGVKKSYRGNRNWLLNEIEALHTVWREGCNVPTIMDVDFEKITLTVSYILGDVLSHKLCECGATLLDRDLAQQFKHTKGKHEVHNSIRIEAALHYMPKAVSSQFLEDLHDQVVRAHSRRIIIQDIHYGNVIIEENLDSPYLIDFAEACSYQSLGKSCFGVLWDREIEQFNRRYGTQKFTHNRLKRIFKKTRVTTAVPLSF